MKKLHAQLGFTMIELLIVITILGILAVAVLSAINPIEQINRGRDTGRQSDAEQLLSAIDRYNAFQGYYPWQLNADAPDTSIMVDSNTGETPTRVLATNWNQDTGAYPVRVTADYPAADLDEDDVWEDTDCPIVARLSTGDDSASNPDDCRGAQEIKDSFITRITSGDQRSLFVYNSGQPGASTYVCFVPQSGAFETQASDRCNNPETIVNPEDWGPGLPEDIGVAARIFICDPSFDRLGEGSDESAMVCLP